MRISIDKAKIILTNPEFFDIEDILECGQVFRFKKLGDKDYIIHSLDKRAHIYNGAGNTVIIDCGGGKDAPYFYNYFDLDTDYADIQKRLAETAGDNPAEHGFLMSAVKHGGGIRILRQDKTETIISFIISANNNIKRIQGIVERLCAALGKDMGGFYAFPTLSALAKSDKKFYNDIGAGYRDGYLYETSKVLADGFDLSAVDLADTETALKLISRLKGVGPKVADCVLLFAYRKFDVFPVDTWIAKVFNRFYGGCLDRREIRRLLVAKYGCLAGYAQQYLFYAARGGKINDF